MTGSAPAGPLVQYLEALLKALAGCLLIVGVLVIVGSFIWKSAARHRPMIGEEMAQAIRAEQVKQSNSKSGPSPLPANLHYDPWLGDLDLSDPRRRPLDDRLTAISQTFAGSDLTSRSRIRNAASMDDFYTLLYFSQRSAVFAMRDRRPEEVVNGLTAIAMIDRSRIDFRDALVALSLLHHAAGVIGANVNNLFEKAAALAEPKMSELILGFLRQSEDYHDIRKSWGYAVIETKGGPGFIGWGLTSYQPTYPLDRIALTVAQVLERDKYGRATVTLASDLPAVWLSRVDDNALKSALTAVRGAVSITADLRPKESPEYKSQFLAIFLAELNDETSARSLLKLSEEKQTRSKDFVLVGVQEGRLFCLAIERSLIAGKASFENPASMQRFSTAIAALLRNQHSSAGL